MLRCAAVVYGTALHDGVVVEAHLDGFEPFALDGLGREDEAVGVAVEVVVSVVVHAMVHGRSLQRELLDGLQCLNLYVSVAEDEAEELGTLGDVLLGHLLVTLGTLYCELLVEPARLFLAVADAAAQYRVVSGVEVGRADVVGAVDVEVLCDEHVHEVAPLGRACVIAVAQCHTHGCNPLGCRGQHVRRAIKAPIEYGRALVEDDFGVGVKVHGSECASDVCARVGRRVAELRGEPFDADAFIVYQSRVGEDVAAHRAVLDAHGL